MPNKPSFNYFNGASPKKTLKKPYKCNFARNFKEMIIVFNSNHFKTIIYNLVLCSTFHAKQTKFELF